MKRSPEIRVGDGPWTVVLWCDRQPAIVSGLGCWPVVGDRFEGQGVVWVVVEDGGSYVAERLAI